MNRGRNNHLSHTYANSVIFQNIRQIYRENDCPTHCGVDPERWGVFGVFDSQFNNAFPLQQTRTGAHGETSHLLYAGNEEIYPAHTKKTNN